MQIKNVLIIQSISNILNIFSRRFPRPQWVSSFCILGRLLAPLKAGTHYHDNLLYFTITITQIQYYLSCLHSDRSYYYSKVKLLFFSHHLVSKILTLLRRSGYQSGIASPSCTSMLLYSLDPLC